LNTVRARFTEAPDLTVVRRAAVEQRGESFGPVAQ
jgi:hypothetical protein